LQHSPRLPLLSRSLDGMKLTPKNPSLAALSSRPPSPKGTSIAPQGSFIYSLQHATAALPLVALTMLNRNTRKWS
jgi:hypothetical protein